MKILMVMTVISLLPAQDYTERYHVKFQRTDYYNKQGKWVGYAKENMRYNRIEFFDTTDQFLKYEMIITDPEMKVAFDRDVPKEGIKRWSRLYQRFELLDSSGQQTGYYKYQPKSLRWIFTIGQF
jgi:hypothetical protein